MSLSPVALQALRAAQSALSEMEADLYEDALARGLEAVDREGRLVGAHSAEELDRLRARVDEVERKYTFDTAELRRENDALRKQVAELEALKQQAARRGMKAYAKVVELGRQLETERLSYQERAARETHPGKRQAWRMLAQAEESERVFSELTDPSVERSVGKLRSLLAPAEDPHDGPLARSYRVPHDLPEMGGAL